MGWLAWQYRVPVDIDNTYVPGTLTNWPLCVTDIGFPAGFWDGVYRADGGDIRWTLEDGTTPVMHELVSFDNGGDTMESHVIVPSVSSSEATRLYCYFGNPVAALPSAADQQAVWSDDFEAVYHLEEEVAGAGGGDEYADSTGNANQGLDYVGATGQTGQIGAGQQFDGVDDYVETETFQSVFRGSFTVSCWIKPDDGQPAATEIPWGSRNAAEEDRVHLAVLTDGKLSFIYQSNNAIQSIARTDLPVMSNGQETWHHVVCVADSTIGGVGGLKLYLDGVVQVLDPSPQDGDTTGVIFADWTSARTLYLAARNDNGSSANEFAGYMDEIRIASVVRADDDIAATFNNQSDPSTFYTVGGVEEQVSSQRRERFNPGLVM